MAPQPPRLRILSVGGNAVSAFLSWRLQATNACDVTLVWKSGYETVSQYGISFKSQLFGNERFKPLHVVRTPEDASSRKSGFDYVLLCVKALPDVYDLAAIIESVVTPQHTCILVNTTNSLGIESHLEERFPTNVVLSLVSGAELTQLGASEFEHSGSTQIWVGAANKNPAIPASIQNDMAEALAMTLTTGQVDCKVSPNIRQQQYDRMIGPVAFHPLSVLFETPSHAELIEKIGVRAMISDIIDELMQIAVAQECTFPPDYIETTIEAMTKSSETNTIMYQDFLAKRPMEIETYLGSPIRLAQSVGLRVPRIETLYSILHNFNTVNQTRPAPSASPVSAPPPNSGRSQLPPRTSSGNYIQPGMNGMPNGIPNGLPNGGPRSRAPSMGGPPPRRGPPPVNGYGPRGPGGYSRGPPSNQVSRRPSFENGDLGEEFSHLALIDDIPEGDVIGGYGMGPMNGATDLDMRERELALRQREMQLREREMNMGRGPRRPPPSRRNFDDDDDDEDEYFDPTVPRGPIPQIDPDNFDMMSVTSKRNRKAPSASQLRKNPEGMGGGRGGGYRFAGGPGPGPRPNFARNRSSQQLMADVPEVGESIMSNPLMGYSSNRYGTVDRKQMADDTRTGSLTRERLDQLAGASMNGMAGAYPTPPGAAPRRTSLSPGDTFGPGRRTSGRPSPPGQGYGPEGMVGTRPSPPGMMRQPVPRYPPGQGNAVAPQQVEQYAGVSKQYPYKSPPQVVRSLTGSASASAGSGESAQIDSENSAHSSQSSFAPRQPIGVVR